MVAALFSAALIIPAARVRGVYFFLVTFGFLGVMESVFLHWTSFTGGDAGILVYTPIIGTGTQTQDYFVILAFAVVTVIVMYRIERSRFGRELAPIGSAEGLAAVSGINVLKTACWRSLSVPGSPVSPAASSLTTRPTSPRTTSACGARSTSLCGWWSAARARCGAPSSGRCR